MNTVAKIIKNERINKNLTQKAVAELLGVTQDSISLWENGKRIPDTQYIKELCKIFDISADYLLGLEDDFGTKTHNEATAVTTYSAEERRLVDYFRQLSPNMQRIALNTLQGMSGGGEDSLHKKA